MRTLWPLALLTLSLMSCSAGSSNSTTTEIKADGTINHPHVPSLELKWSLKEPSYGNNTVSGNLLLGGKTLRAMNLDTRTFAFQLPDKVATDVPAFVASGDNIIAKTYDDAHNEYLKVISRTGKVLNTILIPGNPRSSAGQSQPMLTDTSLYVGSGPALYKYNRADLMNPQAKPVWVKTFTHYTLASFYVRDDNHIFVAPSDGSNQMFSLDVNGQERWKIQLSPAETTIGQTYTMQPYGNNLIVEPGSTGLMSINMDTGKMTWDKPQSIYLCPNANGPADYLNIQGNTIYAGTYSGTCVMAFSADTGQSKWVFNSPNHTTFMNTPLYHNGVVYATNSLMFALDADTGKLLAVGDQFLDGNPGNPLVYDPRHDEILEWGLTGLYAYKPVK